MSTHLITRIKTATCWHGSLRAVIAGSLLQTCEADELLPGVLVITDTHLYALRVCNTEQDATVVLEDIFEAISEVLLHRSQGVAAKVSFIFQIFLCEKDVIFLPDSMVHHNELLALFQNEAIPLREIELQAQGLNNESRASLSSSRFADTAGVDKNLLWRIGKESLMRLELESRLTLVQEESQDRIVIIDEHAATRFRILSAESNRAIYDIKYAQIGSLVVLPHGKGTGVRRPSNEAVQQIIADTEKSTRMRLDKYITTERKQQMARREEAARNVELASYKRREKESMAALKHAESVIREKNAVIQSLKKQLSQQKR